MSDTVIAALIGMAVTLIGYCITIFLWFNGKLSSVSEKVDLKIGMLDEKTSKARHDISNKLSTDLGIIAQRLGTLEREAVRDADLKAMEDRIASRFTEFKVDIKESMRSIGADVKGLIRSVDQLESHAGNAADPRERAPRN